MASEEAVVRVILAEPLRPAEREPTVLQALQTLGSDARIERLTDAAAVRALLASEPVDCVLVDEAREDAQHLVGETARCGVPVVFLQRGEDDEGAVEAFARGARDCVRVGADAATVLPAAVLDQIRRFRVDRDRGEAEARMRWLERLSDTVVEAIPSAIAVLDGVGCVLRANPAFARLSGGAEPALRGRRVSELLEPELREPAAELLRRAAAGRSAGPILARSVGRDARSFDLRAAPLTEGRALLLVSEVTEVEGLLQEVGELRRYNENIIQNMNGALLVVDAGSQVRFANPSAEELLGEDLAALRGRDARSWLERSRAGSEALARTLGEGARVRGVEAVVTRPDGRAVPVAIACAPLLDREGVPQGAVAILQDHTELKQLQRQVLQTEKMASIGQLAAGVAHEINNPMGYVHANLYQVSEYLDELARVWDHVQELRKAAAATPGSPALARAVGALDSVAAEVEADFLMDDIGKAVRESLEGSERVRHIIQDLRAFSHQDTPERMPADVNKALDSTAHIVWTMMKHSVQLTKDYAELPPVSCYPMQIKQVFMNLLVNAYQAVEEHRECAGGRGEIRLATRMDGEGVRIDVQDNGAGIPRDVLPRIFDPFFTTKDVGEGTGLGLSTCYSLVERHTGRLSVESEEGRGARFIVWLPLEGAERAQ